MDKAKAIFHPIISSIQKIALYETKSKYYLVGSNNTQTRFRVLKIDRQNPKELIIQDDKVEYTAGEIRDFDIGNRQRTTSGSGKVISSFGIVGFIKFLEGYYIVLITKRRKVAVVGYHTIYKIEETNMIYIPHESIRQIHPEEQRYVRMFQNIDLASNFYFSYSYNLTHSLQHNLTDPKQYQPLIATNESEEKFKLIRGDYGVRTHPQRKFVWNNHLLREAERELHPDWLLYITHGFIGQSNVNIFGRSVYVTLMARRSSRYAGTRFLKRGANSHGDVANEVETEQMVHDSGVSSFTSSHFTSFVQMRGSIPGQWRQDMGKMVAKPAITLDLYDPYAETSASHFNELLKRYGAPIVILNLVKRRERKKQESLLSDELNSSVKYLNQFLPPDCQIIYKTFDMARKLKGSTNVMAHLGEMADNAVQKTGLFHNQRTYHSQKPSTVLREGMQTGIVRTNCVDCLDRTNTAQFVIGKCVLGYQLCALGILDSPNLQYDTDCVRMLESLYEDHGDTLALQYGGSQLVHRIKTYRKTAPWTSQGNDILQTLSRYYTNTFSDAEKQNTINLFLGIFTPNPYQPQIWDYTSDYYFHHKSVAYDHKKSLSQWYDGEILKCLPYSYNDLTKSCYEIIQIHSTDAEMIDGYADYHRPYELSVLTDVFAFKVSNSVKDFMPNCTTDYSPFVIRIRPVRRRDDHSNRTTISGITMKNPSVTGQSSASSTASSTSSSSDNNKDSCDDEESTYTNDSQLNSSKDSTPEPITFKTLFPSMQVTYGTQLVAPKKADILAYKKYVLIGRKANGTATNVFTPISLNLKPQSHFSADTSIQIEPPKVRSSAIAIYDKYLDLGVTGDVVLNTRDVKMYQRYVINK